ncbi:MAG: hypothetical protein AAFR96_01350 [Planctomycetota bacterium]
MRGAPVLLAAFAACALQACGPAPRPPGSVAGFFGGETPPAGATLDPAQPAVRGATNGLEMRVWVVEDQDEVLAEIVGRFGPRPTPMPDSVRTAWRASGLRVLAVPVDELAAFRERFRVIAPEQRDWFGQSPDWSEAIRGREIAAGQIIGVADGPMRSPAGRLRVLMRCWPTPGASVLDPALHLELAVQLERRDAVPSPVELPALASELEAGVVFPRLRTTMRLDADTALLLIPMPEPEPEPGELPATPAGEGPERPSPPTLGEAMLSSFAPGSPARRRAIVAFLPRLPDRFGLASAAAEPRR